MCLTACRSPAPPRRATQAAPILARIRARNGVCRYGQAILGTDSGENLRNLCPKSTNIGWCSPFAGHIFCSDSAQVRSTSAMLVELDQVLAEVGQHREPHGQHGAESRLPEQLLRIFRAAPELVGIRRDDFSGLVASNSSAVIGLTRTPPSQLSGSVTKSGSEFAGR